MGLNNSFRPSWCMTIHQYHKSADMADPKYHPDMLKLHIWVYIITI